MSTINPVANINAVSPVSASVVSREQRQQNLLPHQIVRATVAEGGQSSVMLELAQRRFPAETRVPLETGQQLDLLVLATSPRLELRVVEQGLMERLGHSLHLLNEPWELSALVQKLVESGGVWLDRLSPQARAALEAWVALQARMTEKPEGKLLQSLAGRLGLDMEARLAAGEKEGAAQGLKSALQEMARSLDGPGTEMVERASRLQQGLELMQLSQIRLAQQGTVLVPLPLPFAEQSYLLYEEGDPPEEGGAAPRRVSLHMTLQGLGDLRVDFLQEDEGLHVRFACENDEKARFVSTYREELIRALESFSLRGLLVATGAASPATDLIRRLVPEGAGVLDTRV